MHHSLPKNPRLMYVVFTENNDLCLFPVKQVVKWAQENILIMRSTTNKWATEQTMDLRLRSLRDRGQLVLIEMRPHSSNGFMVFYFICNTHMYLTKHILAINMVR
jgi:hypothetical protein